MHRFVIDPGTNDWEQCSLSDADSHHALTVLRLKEGQNVEAVYEGHRWQAEIISTDCRQVLIRKGTRLPSTETELRITLYQGLPKSDKMDWIVQKATELGVSKIVPVIMDRCVVRMDPSDSCKKLERWSRIIREAAKQSGRCLIPEITVPYPLSQLASIPGAPEKSIVPWEEAETCGPLSFSRENPAVSSLGILIGPEGGITRKEINLVKTLHFVPITLGKRILRTETAGLAAISAFMCLYGEMESS